MLASLPARRRPRLRAEPGAATARLARSGAAASGRRGTGGSNCCFQTAARRLSPRRPSVTSAGAPARLRPQTPRLDRQPVPARRPRHPRPQPPPARRPGRQWTAPGDPRSGPRRTPGVARIFRPPAPCAAGETITARGRLRSRPRGVHPPNGESGQGSGHVPRREPRPVLVAEQMCRRTKRCAATASPRRRTFFREPACAAVGE